MNEPRGIRNRNPLNIVKSGIQWFGEKNSLDEVNFEVFDTAEHGLRAACRLLLTYESKHGLNTVAGIINRWAPPSENDTGAYIATIAKAINTPADTALALHTPSVLAALCTAMVQHENGQQPYPAAMILEAAESALGLPAKPAPVSVAPPVPSAITPAAKREPEQLTDVPAAELDRLVVQFRTGGATVSVTLQPNGRYTVRAVY